MAKTIELTYNGFHGRNHFNVRAEIEKEMSYDVPEKHVGYLVTISRSAAKRINGVVGCQSHRMVFGTRYAIQGACGCGEGLQDITGKEIDELDNVTIRTNLDYEVRGRYPQN